MKKLSIILALTTLVGCKDIFAPEIIKSQGFLVIVESNTSWVGKIDTFTVSGDSIKWFTVNRPGVCWEIRQTETIGMTRAYGTTPNFTYGWALEQKKYPMWGDSNTTAPNGIIRGCIPEDARYD
jgi:hypothetical protein